MNCQPVVVAAGPAGAAAILGFALLLAAFRGRRLMAAAAEMIALANDFAAEDAPPLRRSLANVTGPARIAIFVSPNRGRTATGTATVATTSLFRFGSRWPR